jgi:hypothetical protein
MPADQLIHIDNFDRAAWREATLARLKSDDLKLATSVLLATYAIELRKNNPTKPVDDLLFDLAQSRHRIDLAYNKGQSPQSRALRDKYDLYVLGIDTLAGLGSGGAEKLGKPLAGLAKYLLGRGLKEMDAVDRWYALKAGYTLKNELRGSEALALDRIAEAAEHDPQLAELIEKGIPEFVPLRDHPAVKIVRGNPKVFPKAVVKGCRDDGTLVVALADMRQLVTDQLAALTAVTIENRDRIRQIDAKQNILVDYVVDQVARQQAEAIASQRAAERQAIFDAAGTWLSVAVSVIGFADDKLAGQVAAVGNAALQVAKSIDDYLTALPTLTALARDVGGLALTGNLVGAALQVISIFTEDPSKKPEAMILDGIANVRSDIAALHTDMALRFDRIDDKLNAIYTTLVDGLGMLQLQTWELRGDVAQLHRDVMANARALDRLSADTQEFARIARGGELHETLNYIDGYTGEPMQSAEYRTYANRLFTWAIDHARDPLEAGWENRPYGDEELASELRRPLDVNVNYLAAWVSQKKKERGLTDLEPFASPGLPNPRKWALAARAYSELQYDWPDLWPNYGPEHDAAMLADGRSLQAAVRRICVKSDGGTNPTFDLAMDHYADAWRNTHDTLDQLESRIVKDLNAERGRTDAIDIWGGPAQHVDPKPDGLVSVPTMDPEAPAPLAPPAWDVDTALFEVADHLRDKGRPAALGFGAAADWIVTRTKRDPQEGYVDYWGKPTCRVVLAHGDVLLAGRSFTGPEQHIGTTFSKADPLPSAHSWLTANWEGGRKVKALFEQGGGTELVTPDERAKADRLRTRLTEENAAGIGKLREAVHSKILAELTGSLRGPLDALDGATSAVQSLVALGLPRVLATDELLQSLLYGSQALVGSYDVANRLLEAESAKLNEARAKLALDAGRRAASLRSHLHRYVAMLVAADYVEGEPTVEESVLRLQVSDRLRRLKSAPDAWISLAGTLAGGPSAARDASGRLRVFARDRAGLTARSQSTNGSGWEGWLALGGKVAGRPVPALDAKGRLTVFIRGRDGALWQRSEKTPGGNWSNWRSLGGKLTADPAVALNPDGRMAAVARMADGTVAFRVQKSAGGSWSGWANLGGRGTGTPALAPGADGRLRLFARMTDGSLAIRVQKEPGGDWSPVWNPIGGTLAGAPVALRAHDARLTVFARGKDGALWQAREKNPNGWSAWISHGGKLAADPAAALGPDGRLAVVACAPDGAFHHRTQKAAGGTWSDWASLGGAGSGTPVLVAQNDGRLWLACRGAEDDLKVRVQEAPGRWG